MVHPVHLNLTKFLHYASRWIDQSDVSGRALLMLVALLFKVAAVPFHFWSPDVYEGSPSLVTAIDGDTGQGCIFCCILSIDGRRSASGWMVIQVKLL